MSNKNTRVIFLLVVLMFVISVFSIKANTIVTHKESKLSDSDALTLSKTDIICKKGDTINILATAGGKDSIREYGSENKAIATFEKDPVSTVKCANCMSIVVSCRSVGKTNIYVTTKNGKKISTSVTVNPNEIDETGTDTKIEDVEDDKTLYLDRGSISCKAGESAIAVLHGKYLRAYFDKKEIATVSVHPNLELDCKNCTVLQIICKKEGSTTLTIENKLGKKITARVGVSKNNNTISGDISFDKSSYTANMKTVNYMYVNISTKSEKVVKVESSDEKIATITLEEEAVSKGKYRAKIKCLQDGEVKFTATDDKGKTATTTLTIKNSGTIDLGPDFNCRKGDITKINISAIGINNNYVGLKGYYSDDENIAKVALGDNANCSGCLALYVKCNELGSTTIHATSSLGAIGTVKVNVADEKMSNTVEFLDKEVLCVAGEKITTTVTAGSDKIKEVKSSNPEVAKVSVNEIEGQSIITDRMYALTVSCLKDGEATITAKSNKQQEATTTIKVSKKKDKDEIVFDNDTISCIPGQKIEINAYSKQGVIKEVSTSNRGIATIQHNELDPASYISMANTSITGAAKLKVGCVKTGKASITVKNSLGTSRKLDIIIKDSLSESKVSFVDKYTCKPNTRLSGLIIIENALETDSGYEKIVNITSSDKSVATAGIDDISKTYSTKIKPSTIMTPFYIYCEKEGIVSLTAKTEYGSKDVTKVSVLSNGTSKTDTRITFNKGNMNCTVGKSVTFNVTSTGSLIHELYSDNLFAAQVALTEKTLQSPTSEVRTYKLSCLKEGTATIRAITEDGTTNYIKITSTTPARIEQEKKIEFSNETIICKEGDKVFTKVIKYGGESLSSIKTSDKTVATIAKETRIESSSYVDYLMVTCLKEGKAEITAIGASGTTANIKADVRSLESADIILATSISIDIDSVDIKLGEDRKVDVTIKPDNVTSKKVIWKTSNKNVATVEDGVIKGIGTGTAIITAMTENGYKDTLTVTVKTDSTYSAMNVDKTLITCVEGDDVNIKATGTSKVKTFTSSDESIAKIAKNDDSTYKVSCLKEGTSTIKFKGEDGASISVKAIVEKKIELKIKAETDNIECKEGETKTLNVSGTSNLASAKSRDTKLASVKQSGTNSIRITCLEKGTTKIIVQGEDGAEDSIKVKIQ